MQCESRVRRVRFSLVAEGLLYTAQAGGGQWKEGGKWRILGVLTRVASGKPGRESSSVRGYGGGVTPEARSPLFPSPSLD